MVSDIETIKVKIYFETIDKLIFNQFGLSRKEGTHAQAI